MPTYQTINKMWLNQSNQLHQVLTQKRPDLWTISTIITICIQAIVSVYRISVLRVKIHSFILTPISFWEGCGGSSPRKIHNYSWFSATTNNSAGATVGTFVWSSFFFQKQLVQVESVNVSKLFSVSVVSVSYLGGQVLLVAVRYGWIVGDVCIVSCLLKFKFSLQLQMFAAVLSRSFNSVMHFPS